MGQFSNVGSDAGEGASLGGALGSVVPGLGNAIGTGVGALVGAGGAVLADITGEYGNSVAANTAQQGISGFQAVSPQETYQDVGGIPQSAFDTTSQEGNDALGDALSQLQQKYSQGGLNAGDIDKVATINQGVDSEAAAGRAAVQNEAQARGESNSSLNYISQLVGGQQSAEQGLQAAQGQAAIAEQQKTAESGQIASIGQQIQQNAYTVAGANDAIAQFNKGLDVSNNQNTLNAKNQSITNQLNQAAGEAGVYSNVGALQEGGNIANTQNMANAATSLSGLPQALSGMGGGVSNPQLAQAPAVNQGAMSDAPLSWTQDYPAYGGGG